MKYLIWAIGAISLAASITSCGGDASMPCKSDIHKKLSSMLEDGKTTGEILAYLDDSGIEYIDVSKDDFTKYGDVAPNQPDLSGVILISTGVHPGPAEGDASLVHVGELVKIGYGDGPEVISYECREVFTGP